MQRSEADRSLGRVAVKEPPSGNWGAVLRHDGARLEQKLGVFYHCHSAVQISKYWLQAIQPMSFKLFVFPHFLHENVFFPKMKKTSFRLLFGLNKIEKYLICLEWNWCARIKKCWQKTTPVTSIYCLCDLETYGPFTGEEICVWQILAGPRHVLHRGEEVQVVLVQVQVEELCRHVRALHHQLQAAGTTGHNGKHRYSIR